MNTRMNYLNRNNEIEEVNVLGYAKTSSNWYDANYCECWTEDKGNFIVPITRLMLTKEIFEEILSKGEEENVFM